MNVINVINLSAVTFTAEDLDSMINALREDRSKSFLFITKRVGKLPVYYDGRGFYALSNFSKSSIITKGLPRISEHLSRYTK